MAEKTYCGIGRVVETKFGKMLKLSMTEEDVKTLQENIVDGWVNVDVGKRKEPSERGTTHYLTVNTWKPEKKEAKKDEPATEEDFEF